MQYFRAENLTKTYVKTPIIDHVTFTINKGDKIALVAKNGGGKTTLLNLMMGKLDMTEGTVERKRGITPGYLSQHFELNKDNTVADEVFQTDHIAAELIRSYEEALYTGDSDILTTLIPKLDEYQVRNYQSKVDTILARLQLQDLLDHKIETLSGGEKKRVALAKLLIDEKEILVLDEPTNHLDVQMIEWLENYLKTENTTLFLVTHDRYFLESVCDEIYELDRGKLYKYPANYEEFLEQQAQRHENEQIEHEKLRQLLKRELEWIRKSPRARATKQKFREKEFYKIEKQYDTEKALYKSENVSLDIPYSSRQLGTKILEVKHLNKALGNKQIVKDFSHSFKYQERIGLVGKNGVGKSSFIALLLGKLQSDTGEIEYGKTLVFGEYQQEGQEFPKDKTVIDVLKDNATRLELKNGEVISAEKLLERFLFTPAQRYQSVEKLSGGEKRRLALLCLLIKNPNFLILDEPTNDLDLITISILEDFLLNYKGCLIIVSHDRSFMDRLVDHIFIFEGNGVISDYWGTYSQRKGQQESKNQESSKKKNTIPYLEKEKNIEEDKWTLEEKRELEELIRDLEALEQEKAEITQLFNNKDLAYDDITLLSEHLGEIMKTIERKEARWFELIER